MKLKKFNNKQIAFDIESEMVNATDMMQAFPGKKMNNFLRSQQTKEYIEVLELKTRKSVIKKSAGRYGGTWMHKLLAFKFAAWLNPLFELFVYETFDEAIQNKLKEQQKQLDYFWDKSDQQDLYR